MEELTEEPAELVERVAALEGLGGVARESRVKSGDAGSCSVGRGLGFRRRRRRCG
jgi:hypothetical protein